jgi:hypothetical protein
LLGVIAMLAAILILLAMPFTDLGKSRGLQFKLLSKVLLYTFIANFLILMVLGAKHVESPYIELGQLTTFIYFGYFLFLVPFISLLENTLVELSGFYTISNLTHNSYRSRGLNSFSYTGKRNFSTTPIRLMDSSNEGEDSLDPETREEYEKEKSIYNDAKSAYFDLITQITELEDMKTRSNEDKIEYTKSMSPETVTSENVDEVIDKVEAELNIAKDNALSD